MDAIGQKARNLRNAATDAEHRLWHHFWLKQLGGYKFRRQAPVLGYIADFFCFELKLIIEVDGGQRVDHAARDAARTRKLETAGCRVLRSWDDEVLLRTIEVL